AARREPALVRRFEIRRRRDRRRLPDHAALPHQPAAGGDRPRPPRRLRGIGCLRVLPARPVDVRLRPPGPARGRRLARTVHCADPGRRANRARSRPWDCRAGTVRSRAGSPARNSRPRARGRRDLARVHQRPGAQLLEPLVLGTRIGAPVDPPRRRRRAADRGGGTLVGTRRPRRAARGLGDLRAHRVRGRHGSLRRVRGAGSGRLGRGGGRHAAPGRGRPARADPGPSAGGGGGARCMNEVETHVLIVGGSLVGLSAAVFLGARGVPCLVVERHRGTAIHPRAALVNQRTMETYRAVGIEPAIEEAAAREFVQNGAIVSVESLGGKELDWYFRTINEGVEDLSPSARIFITQIGLEPVLLAKASEVGARVEYAAETVSLDRSDDGVVATIRPRDGGDDWTVRAQYAIAADGAHSPSRERLGIPMLGHGSFSDSITIYFRADVTPLLGDR